MCQIYYYTMGTIMVKFEKSLHQKLQARILIRLSYLEKIFYEKNKFDDLCAQYHGIPLPIQPIQIESVYDKII